MHEQTILCRQLFAGHEVGSRPMERKKTICPMTIILMVPEVPKGLEARHQEGGGWGQREDSIIFAQGRWEGGSHGMKVPFLCQE